MSDFGHIVSVQNTNTEEGENMLDILTSNLSMLMLSAWGCLTTYVSWYATKAKRSCAITPAEAKQLWTIHKQNAHCNGKKWHQLKKGKQTIGFQCECGYRHTQKKPLVTHTPATMETPQVSAFDRLHTTHKSA
jgi:hypothetical protein